MRPALAIISSFFLPLVSWGQLECVPCETLQTAFSGQEREVRILFRNPADQAFQGDIKTCLYQASSSTLMPVSKPKPWKSLQVLSHQTIVESIKVAFPAVKASTRFQIHWLDANGKKLGWTDVLVYPDDILKQLKVLAGDRLLGVMDPGNQVKPILKQLGVEIENLESAADVEVFHGQLLLALFATKEQVPENIAQKLAACARQGRAVVWIHPFPTRAPFSISTASLARLGAGALLAVQPAAIAHLDTSPSSQLNLVGFAEMAVHPDAMPPSNNL